jgi:metallophosphoesterase (TIGR00282 family)
MRLLFFGDIFGKSGRTVFLDQIGSLREEYAADLVIVNGENIADGKGLTEKTVRQLFQFGVDSITGGNHLWDRAESLDFIRGSHRIVKPLNYPSSTPGLEYQVLETGPSKLAVLCITGQVFMPPCDSPFAAFDRWWEQHSNEDFCVLLDFHAESTAEKRAMGWHVDGRASALLGTHTHVQTADEEILPGGTAYISDVGMTGPHDSVIGMKKNIILDKFRHGIPIRYEVSDRGLQINAVCVDIDPQTRTATSITRIRKQVNSLQMNGLPHFGEE